MATNMKRIRKSKYKYVSLYHTKDKTERWGIHIGTTLYYDTEERAAKAVDMWLIKQGKWPINILKPFY